MMRQRVVLSFAILGCLAMWILGLAGVSGPSFAIVNPSATGAPSSSLRIQTRISGSSSSAGSSTSQWAVGGMAALACIHMASRVLSRQVARRAGASCEGNSLGEILSRRAAALQAASVLALAPVPAAFAEPVAEEDLPAKIKADPYDLIGMENREDKKEDQKEFYMKKNYKEDTYQVLKHMKISGSLDKGTPNMEAWNTRVKEEMNDWVALYRRQDAVVGRQSYYALYSAVNTLASHFTSYGTKFPFPNKRRPRFYELINQTERFLEKNK